MDQELKAYLEQHFRETSRQIEELRGETARQFEESRGETSRQFEESRGELGQLRGEFEEFRGETSRQFAEVHQESRQGRVLLEGIRSDLRLLAEGVIATGQKFVAHQAETRLSLEKMEAAVHPYYRDLNSRVRLLEEKVEDLKRDPMDLIREKFGSNIKG
jgi:hypothetical protein